VGDSIQCSNHIYTRVVVRTIVIHMTTSVSRRLIYILYIKFKIIFYQRCWHSYMWRLAFYSHV